MKWKDCILIQICYNLLEQQHNLYEEAFVYVRDEISSALGIYEGSDVLETKNVGILGKI